MNIKEADVDGKIDIGVKAPDFTLPSSTGENISLSQFIGKKNVVIFFYPMDESPVCSREAEAFRNKYEAFKDLGAEVLGISSQNVESHKSFSNHHNLPYFLLSDINNNVRRLYGVSSTLGIVPKRVTFVIDKEGVIKYIFSSQLQPAKHARQAFGFIIQPLSFYSSFSRAYGNGLKSLEIVEWSDKLLTFG